jgi:hypothetical protein
VQRAVADVDPGRESHVLAQRPALFEEGTVDAHDRLKQSHVRLLALRQPPGGTGYRPAWP